LVRMASKFGAGSGPLRRLTTRTDSERSMSSVAPSRTSSTGEDRDRPDAPSQSLFKRQESTESTFGVVSKIAAGMTTAKLGKARDANDKGAGRFFKLPAVKRGRTREPLSEDAQSMISSNFKVFDKDGSNTISFSELQSAFKAVLGYEASAEEMEDILQRLNITGSKEIGMQAFEREMTARFQERVARAESDNVFDVLNGEANADEDGKSDFLSLDNLRSSLQSLGLYSKKGGDGRISEEELFLMCAHTDFDADGCTSREDFFAYMRMACLF